MSTDQFVGLEFVERRLDAQRRGRQPGVAEARQSMLCRMALAPQFTAVAMVERGAEPGQVVTENLRLAHTIGAEDVVVVRTEGGLAMSNQINTAHTRYPRIEVSRG